MANDYPSSEKDSGFCASIFLIDRLPFIFAQSKNVTQLKFPRHGRCAGFYQDTLDNTFADDLKKLALP